MKLELDTEQLRQDIVNDVVEALKPLLADAKREDDHLMDIGACASYLLVERQWLYKVRNNLQIPFVKVGKFLRFRKSEIDKWLQKNSTRQVNECTIPQKITGKRKKETKNDTNRHPPYNPLRL